MFFKKTILMFLMLVFVFSIIYFAQAKSACVPDCKVGLLITNPECACCGDCTLTDFLVLGINFANLSIKIIGIVALVFFVIGGVVWIISAGSAEKVAQGKKMIVGAIVGMVIAFAAFSGIKFLGKALGIKIEKYTEITGVVSEKGDNVPWPACPIPPKSGREWCYGCTWTGGEGRGCQGGNEIKDFKAALNELDCGCGETSNFDKQTKSCVEKFQKANKLTVTGMVGAGLWGTLKTMDWKPCQ